MSELSGVNCQSPSAKKKIYLEKMLFLQTMQTVSTCYQDFDIHYLDGQLFLINSF